MTDVKIAYDAATLATLRRALDQVLTHPRFLHSTSVSALEMAEHILSLAATGERDIERLRNSALSILATNKAA
jgi:hypothetical protein